MTIIDGKALSAKIKERVKKDCEELIAKGIKPTLAVILVGQDKASQSISNICSKQRKSLHRCWHGLSHAPPRRANYAK